jgi:DHA2 family multidrug resistance protein
MPNSAAAPIAVPGLRRTMVTICAMTATIMQALDTTIANVALPYMQGSLSASQDQINWVLTSYIVAARRGRAGRVDHNRFRHRRIFIICSGGFTIASVLCGAARDPTRWCCSGCCRACSAPPWYRCREPSCWTLRAA